MFANNNNEKRKTSGRYDNLLTKRVPSKPGLALPQDVSVDEQARRQYDLSLRRLSYNYMRSYPSLENVPVSAELPAEEMYDDHYDQLVSDAQTYISHNFQTVLQEMLETQLGDNVRNANLDAFKETGRLLKSESGLLDFFKDITKITTTLPGLVENSADSLSNFPPDIRKIFTGFLKVQEQSKTEGPTAYLKSALHELLAHDKGRDYLHAKCESDYQRLYRQLPTPAIFDLPRKPWMSQDGAPLYHQDWFFAYLQVAGFNTTQLVGVTDQDGQLGKAAALSRLLRKFPLTDTQFQNVIGDRQMTLQEAARLKRLYVVDYAMFDGIPPSQERGALRHVAAPIALFYWNPTPPAGYQQDTGGALQPVAIQCSQHYHEVESPIFSPKDVCNAGDPNGLKWRLAKYIVNAACAVHHESIAHFGACHLTVEPVVLATHRQLSNRHPLHKLLMPHFKFNININDDARHKLIAPGGVIATNIGAAISDTLKQVAKARLEWKWDENRPDRLFHSRAAGAECLPSFPFRDDTLLLWQAIREFVAKYVRHYYHDDRAVAEDTELQGWIHELTSPLYAGFNGMNGLVSTGDSARPHAIEDLNYLIDVVAQIIYIAGPQHAAANYAQYPLMSYVPCVSGTIYKELPGKHTVIDSPEALLEWYPPLDVALYSLSFEYLLSGVQYDRLGHYDQNLRHPYFEDAVVLEAVAEFQENLADAEKQIRRRNLSRPVPYVFQLPSRMPNSISI